MTQAVENVADTAFLVAALREAETNRPDALFHDPLAAKPQQAHAPASDHRHRR